MKILGIQIGKPKPQAVKEDVRPYASYELVGTYSAYDGEKSLGEIGPLVSRLIDFKALSVRAWEARLTNEIAATILKKFTLWVIGEGLKLKCDPKKVALKSEGITLNPESFNEIVEARFEIWAKSRYSGYNGQDSLNILAKKGFDSAGTGGDILVILRFVNKITKVQLIDGCHIVTPFGISELTPLVNGNNVKNGIETTPEGEHAAYYIRKKNFQFERIEAINKRGLKVAYIVYGQRHRLDDNRGISRLSASLESLAKIDRYKEAAVGSAEEQAKVSYFVKHDINSSGENPLSPILKKAHNIGSDSGKIPIDVAGNEIANTVAVTTKKMSLNMPPGATLESLTASNTQFYYAEFLKANIDLICAGIGIPPNVAMSLYNDSFSASRAATKDWEHTLFVNRSDFQFQFYQPIYDFWLHTEILKMKVQAPGYLQAFKDDNLMVLQSYRNCRFTGPLFPHIDPLKEVNAERAKLGPLFDNIPLTTIEQATENLNCGDSDSNMLQASEELDFAETLDLKVEEPPLTVDANGIKSKQPVKQD